MHLIYCKLALESEVAGTSLSVKVTVMCQELNRQYYPYLVILIKTNAEHTVSILLLSNILLKI